METPSWVKRFENPGPNTGQLNQDGTWPYSTTCSSVSETTPSIHTSHSYGDFASTTSTASGSQFIPRIRTVRSAPDTMSWQEKRRKKRRRRPPADETSGYSTNSLSELSELEVERRPRERRSYAKSDSSRIPEDDIDDRSERSRETRFSKGEVSRQSVQSEKSDRFSKAQSARQSKQSIQSEKSDKFSKSHTERQSRHSVQSEGSKTSNRTRASADRQSIQSGQSSSSAQRNKKNTTGGTQSTKSNAPAERTFDPNDPFAFIQPVPPPFSVRFKKLLGRIMGIMLLFILAGSIGAAIYFAAALKKTQENEIEFLKANLAMKIRNTPYSKDLDDLTQADFNFLALTYCKQMDEFYQNSKFRHTYRGCEVISIKNQQINFSLFFVEKEAKQQDIVSVIESSAPRLEDQNQSLALVDKFEIELDSLRVQIEHKKEAETFNKIVTDKELAKATFTSTARPLITAGKTVTPKRDTTTVPTTITVTTVPITRRQTNLVTTSRPKSKSPTEGSGQVYSWNPCAEYEGNFFPHPVECNLYFQCQYGESVVRSCFDMLFDWTANVCVPKSAPNVECPDPAKAPSKPQSETSTSADLPLDITKPTADPTKKVTSNDSTKKPNNQTSSLYPSRPNYERDPCISGVDGALYPHPDTCEKFIQCVSGEGVIMPCPTGLVFDPDKPACIFPPNELHCPDMKPCEDYDEGYFPHPYNCSLFIQCEFREEKILSCKPGLVWNPTFNSCVHRTVNSVCPEEGKRK